MEDLHGLGCAGHAKIRSMLGVRNAAIGLLEHETTTWQGSATLCVGFYAN